jgi:Holliday junction resolvase RusA-like endonuclease
VSVIHIRVYGLPAPQGSKTSYGGGRMVESCKKVMPWRADVRIASMAVYSGPLLEGPVALSMVFLFARPKSHMGVNGLLPSAPEHLTSQKAGDIDKLCRSTCDGLSASAGGALLRDDKQIVSLSAQKRYCVGDERPGALLTVMLHSAADAQHFTDPLPGGAC